MNRKSRIAFAVALVFGTTALCIGFHNAGRVIPWNDLHFQNDVAVKSFTPSRDDHLNVELYAQRKLLPPAAKCAMQLAFHWHACAKEDWVLELSWTLTESGKLVASGDASGNKGGSMSEDEFGRMIADFSVTAGKAYTLTLTAHNDLAPLLAARPRIALEPNSLELKDHGVLATLAMTVAIIAFCIGVTGSTASRKAYVSAYTVKWLFLLLPAYAILDMLIGSGPAAMLVLGFGFYKICACPSGTGQESGATKLSANKR